MKTPIDFIVIMIYISLKKTKIDYYDQWAVKNSFGFIAFNMMTIGMFFFWFNWSNYIYLFLSIIVLILYIVSILNIYTNKKYYFKAVSQFLKIYRNKEQLILKHYRFYSITSVVLPVILFFGTLFAQSLFYKK